MRVEDHAAWDDELLRAGGGFLQSWRWGEFKRRHGWVPVRLRAGTADDGRILGQVLFRRVGPFSVAYAPRGPVGSFSPEALALFTAQLDRECRRTRAIAAFIEPSDRLPSVTLGGVVAWSQSRSAIQPERTIKVRVDVDDEAILAQMKPKTRYNVRLADRRGVRVRVGTPDDFDAFYAIMRETSERDQFGIHDARYYRELLEIFGSNARLLIAELHGQMAAGIILVHWGQDTAYLYGASSTALQRHMPAYALQFAGMRWARENGSTFYDLWGIPTEAELPPEIDSQSAQLNVRAGMWGLYRFKQGFGGDVVEYPGMFQRVYYKRLFALWKRVRPNLL